jgi:predicted permease
MVFGLNTLALIAFIMQASMPVAVATIIFANEFQLDQDQVLGGVVVSTLVRPVTLSILILLLQKLSIPGRA